LSSGLLSINFDIRASSCESIFFHLMAWTAGQEPRARVKPPEASNRDLPV
jgi:hypothetical protein